MRLNDIQYKALEPYSQHFKTMVTAGWARNPGAAALEMMQGIYNGVTGQNQRINTGCQHCIMRLIRELGKIYLADVEERNKAIVSKIDENKPTVKAKVKTIKAPKTTA